jgi:hypothetical protein
MTMTEWRDFVGLAITAFLGGGMWKAYDVWRIGRKEKQSAQATHQRVLDVLHRSRAYLLDEIGRLRQLCRDHNVPEVEIGPIPDERDPWARFRRDTEDDRG